jgi:hypothetical protein
MSFVKFSRCACIAIFALACVAFAGSARAQQQPSAAALAAAKEILQLKGSLNIFEPLVPGVVEQAKGLFTQQNPNLSKDISDAAAALRTELAPRRDQLNDAIARLYALRFTEQELKDTLVFFKTPLGKKLLVEEPTFVEQTLRFAQDWANKLSEEVVEKMRTAMRKKGHNL